MYFQLLSFFSGIVPSHDIQIAFFLIFKKSLKKWLFYQIVWIQCCWNYSSCVSILNIQIPSLCLVNCNFRFLVWLFIMNNFLITGPLNISRKESKIQWNRIGTIKQFDILLNINSNKTHVNLLLTKFNFYK